jgi:hypothetical protein
MDGEKVRGWTEFLGGQRRMTVKANQLQKIKQTA